VRGQGIVFEAIKQWLRRHWPKLRLRTILFGTFLFVAALPGFGAVFLRVYENTLVRQTESELIAQGAALAAAAGHRAGGPQSPRQFGYYRSETPQIDLSRSPIYQERPNPMRTTARPAPEMELLAQRMAPIIAETGRSTLASVMLVDHQGLVLTGVYRRQSFGHVGEVRAALKGRTITKLRINSSYKPRYDFEWLTRAANLRVHHARPIIIDGKVVGVLLLSRSSRALFRGVYQDRAQILLGILVIFGVLVGLTVILHRGIARPIEALSIATRKVAAGQGEIPEPPATAAIEIRALYRDFADMSQSIAHRSRYLRNFAAAVSHEFKTPLASIRGGIELIEDHHGTMTEKERRRFLGNISADAGRLSSLVSRLMDLARADMMKPDLDAATELLDVLPSVADAMRIEGFEVQISCGPDLPPVAMPAATLERVLLGLLENSRQAGATEAQMAATRANGDIILTLKDDGPGIPENDRERLFEPFFTSKRAEGGTGLGLSIAQSLVEANRGTISLLPSTKGATFELVLPVAAVV
jgi:signal transduction histidine kinase